jgi:ABC-type bacteriocin/lantibiotic exporter with double-glycine peptidase domain
MIINHQVDSIVNYFKKLFHLDADTAKKAENQGHTLNERIRDTQKRLEYMNYIQPILLGSLLTLIVVTFLYMIGGPILGGYVHMIASLAIVVGVLLTVNFSGGLSNG